MVSSCSEARSGLLEGFGKVRGRFELVVLAAPGVEVVLAVVAALRVLVSVVA